VSIEPDGSSWSVMIDLEVAQDPIQTLFYEVTSYSVVQYFEVKVAVIDCAAIVITPPSALSLNIPKNEGL